MSLQFGSENVALRNAIRRIVSSSTVAVRFRRHAEIAMDEREFDHADVFVCLAKGMAYGPEVQNNELRANVVHRGKRIRVVVGGLDDVNGDWSQLTRITVVTVIEAP